jgi:hypothetical protein
MHITMVKKRLVDGSECRKCLEATEHLRTRGLLDRVDDVVWALEADPESPGMRLGRELGVDQAPFFVVREGVEPPVVYVSVLQLVRERLGQVVTAREAALAIDADDVGGI